MPVNGQQLYVSPDWAAVLGAQGLDCFEAWWALQLDEVEPGNLRRGGWSTVFRHVVDGAGGLFVKRQEDHVYRTLRHPLRGRLTVEREFQVLRQCRAAGIAVPEPVLYGARQDAGHQRGVLVTRELAGYRALVDVLDDWQRSGWPERATRERLLRALADVLRRLHALKLEHRCLYPKHVMVHAAWLAGERDRLPAPVALIDLEKCKRRWRRADCTRRDLDTLNRRSAGWSRTDRRRFLGYYLGAGRRLDAAGRRLWRQLARRS